MTWDDVLALLPAGQWGIWVIDASSGNLKTAFRDLSSCGEPPLFLLDFEGQWRALEPTGDVVLLVHVDDSHLWVVNPHDIRCGMVYVGMATGLEAAANCLAASRLDLFCPSERARAQSRVFVKQDPPGSGKTYALVRMPLCPDEYPTYKQYSTFIYITKPHSAKEVVFKEFSEQLEKVPDAKEVERGERNKGYWKRIEVRGRTILILFVTGDSLFCRLGHHHPGELDVFEGICKTIAEKGPLNMGPKGQIELKGQKLRMCATTLVCMDEATKFSQPYAKALAKIICTCNADAVIAGDCLQSIETKDNVLVYAVEANNKNLEPFLGAETSVEKGCSILRCGPELVGVIGNLVPWGEYNLPVPMPAEDLNHRNEGEFTVQVLPHDMEDELRVQTVIDTAKKSAMNMRLLPNDLLCVFLFVSKNRFGDALRDALHSMWGDLLEDPGYRSAVIAQSSEEQSREAREYIEKYDEARANGQCVWLAYFHRSEENRPVQTRDSENSTRMVSVHASQGDGRRLVFVFGLQENAIKKFFTHGEQNICYYSFINVACSRAKEQTVVFQEGIYDDVWKRFGPYMDTTTRSSVEPVVRINPGTVVSKVDYDGADSGLREFFIDIMRPHLDAADGVKIPQPLVDFQHHEVRAAMLHLVLLLQIWSEESTQEKQHAQALLRGVAAFRVEVTKDYREYHRIQRAGFERERVIPLLDYSRNGSDGFHRICSDICTRLKSQQQCIIRWVGESNRRPVASLLDELTKDPKDIVALYYAIEGSNDSQTRVLRMDTLYDIYRGLDGDGGDLQTHFSCLAFTKEITGRILDSTGTGGGMAAVLEGVDGHPYWRVAPRLHLLGPSEVRLCDSGRGHRGRLLSTGRHYSDKGLNEFYDRLPRPVTSAGERVGFKL